MRALCSILFLKAYTCIYQFFLEIEDRKMLTFEPNDDSLISDEIECNLQRMWLSSPRILSSLSTKSGDEPF
jgi:hypothetical protein